MTPREKHAAAFERETELRKQLGTPARQAKEEMIQRVEGALEGLRAEFPFEVDGHTRFDGERELVRVTVRFHSMLGAKVIKSAVGRGKRLLEQASLAPFVKNGFLHAEAEVPGWQERAELQRQIREAANETRGALLAIGPAAPEGRGLQQLRSTAALSVEVA